MTVLFADLAGSTALGERLDPEDVRELQGELFDLINTEVERFGGTTEKFAGDAVLAVFGIPQAHEDDAERAVRAALAVRDAFGSFTERVLDRHDAEVGLRIGVNTGEVVSGREAAARGELMVSGDAVNVAARLQQHAEPGEVLVGAADAGRDEPGRLRIASARPSRPRGRASPCAPGSPRPPQPSRRSPPRGIAGLTAPLVGRDEELAILTRRRRARRPRARAAARDALRRRPGSASRACSPSSSSGLPDARVLSGRCLPYGEGITYWPLAEAAKAHARDPRQRSGGRRARQAAGRDRVGRARRARPSACSRRPPGRSGSRSRIAGVTRPARGGASPEGRLGALRRRRSAASSSPSSPSRTSTGPPSALLDLVEQLADDARRHSRPARLHGPARAAGDRPTWGAGKQNATPSRWLRSRPGRRPSSISSLLGESQVPPDVRERVLASAEGNPFFLEEMLTMLIEEGALERRNGGWVSTARLADVSIPDSVHGVIAARIDLLDASPRDALRRCSVVGRMFWPSAVGVDEDVIASLVRSGLVTDSRRSVVAGMREFAFKHALTRDVAYATPAAPGAARAASAGRRSGSRRWRGIESGEAAELAAYHYGQALAYGEDDPAVARRAFELLLEASEAAYRPRGFRGGTDASRGRPGTRRSTIPIGRASSSRSPGWTCTEARARPRCWSCSTPRGRGSRRSDAELRSDVLGVRSRGRWLSGRWDEALTSATEAVTALDGTARVAAAGPRARPALPDRDAEAAAEAIATAEQAIDVAQPRRRPVRRGERPDQPLHPALDRGHATRPRRGARRSSTRPSRPASTRRRTGRSST